MEIAAIRLLRARLDAVIARAVISRVNDALKTQRLQLQILADETVDDVEHFQPYGLSFVPPVGSECIALGVAGARSHTIAICAQHPDQRPKDKGAKTGGLYTSGVWRLFIDANGIVHLGADSGAEFVALAQKVLNELNAIRTKFDAHIHTTTATIGLGPTLGVIAVPTSTFGGPAGSVAATKVKAT